jgi:PKHD-type hydroxylase
VLLHIPNVLDSANLRQCQDILAQANWADGRITAGTQAAQVKNNRQLPENSEAAASLRKIVLQALSQNALFFSAALPKRIYPPLFNHYAGAHNSFGNHVDNAIRTHPISAMNVRTDLAFTLFLSAPESYQGGELVIEDGISGRALKLPAGDLILYPAYSVHRVEAVTSGTRLACFSWLESLVRAPEQRRVLFDLDMAILALRETHGDDAHSVSLTNCYHNLMRMWAST